MKGRGRANSVQESSGGRRSSRSSISLNPEAKDFNYGQRDSHGCPVGPSAHGRNGRAKGRTQPGPFAPPNMPPGLGRQGQHPQPLPITQETLPPFMLVPGSGYQPMYPTMYLPPLSGHQQPRPEYQTPDQNSVSPYVGQSKTSRQSVASVSTEAHSRSASGSSQHESPIMTEKMIRDKYREEFEAARSFEDGHVYFPGGFVERKKKTK